MSSWYPTSHTLSAIPFRPFPAPVARPRTAIVILGVIIIALLALQLFR